jgi:hypothetical protein
MLKQIIYWPNFRRRRRRRRRRRWWWWWWWLLSNCGRVELKSNFRKSVRYLYPNQGEWVGDKERNWRRWRGTQFTYGNKGVSTVTGQRTSGLCRYITEPISNTGTERRSYMYSVAESRKKNTGAANAISLVIEKVLISGRKCAWVKIQFIPLGFRCVMIQNKYL